MQTDVTLRCRIRVKGWLELRWVARFEPLTTRRTRGGDTIIEGEIRDQAHLHGVLSRIRDTGLPIQHVLCAPRKIDHDHHFP